MKKFALLSALMFASVAGAEHVHEDTNTTPRMITAESVYSEQKSCSDAVVSSHAWLVNAFGPRSRTGAMGQTIEITALDEAPTRPVFMRATDVISDMLLDGDTLYVLMHSTLEAWNLKTKELIFTSPTSLEPQADNDDTHAMGFAKSGDTLVIAHGRQGLSLFDLKTKKIVHQQRFFDDQLPYESKLIDVVVSEGKAVFAVMNYHLTPHVGTGAFRGMMVYDLETREMMTKFTGIDPGLNDLEMDGDLVVLNYENFFWKASMTDLLSRSREKKFSLVYKFPMKGHPIGRIHLRKETVMGCFLKAPDVDGGKYARIPLVMQRGPLGL